jgi:hypothetical protein
MVIIGGYICYNGAAKADNNTISAINAPTPLNLVQFNQLLIFDTKKSIWSHQVTGGGPLPSPRTYHSSIVMSKYLLINAAPMHTSNK